MRNKLSPFISALAVFIIAVSLMMLFLASKQQGSKKIIYSPVPDFLSLSQNKQVVTTAIFTPNIPKETVLGVFTESLSSEAALVYDLTTQKTFYAKNQTKRLPMASLTKVMTAIIAIENQVPDDRYLVTKEALVGEDSMGATPGETYSLEELLYGLILVSGNDAAEVLAMHFKGGRNAFIAAMNEKARSLGALDTHFTNPTGLQGDGDQYTTAQDLLVITAYAIERFPLFIKVVSTYEKTLPYSQKHKALFLYNETNLRTSYPGIKGVKTGYTPEAGLCLITYLDYKGHKIIGVLLGSSNRREEMRELLNYSLRSQGVEPPIAD
ncbi:MAG: D-alanyl-D-alanine carboxypeptidase [Candidatus Levybacteria bacterium]|nr:D-alanyl-D-alanine carboxypeptidase [Candidatus Levybacteria bacterium]